MVSPGCQLPRGAFKAPWSQPLIPAFQNPRLSHLGYFPLVSAFSVFNSEQVRADGH